MEKKYTQAAEVHKTLGNPHRIALLQILRDGETPREKFLERSRLSNPVFAQHLARLRKSGLVQLRKKGKETHYRLADSGVLKLCDEASAIYKRSYEG